MLEFSPGTFPGPGNVLRTKDPESCEGDMLKAVGFQRGVDRCLADNSYPILHTGGNQLQDSSIVILRLWHCMLQPYIEAKP